MPRSTLEVLQDALVLAQRLLVRLVLLVPLSGDEPPACALAALLLLPAVLHGHRLLRAPGIGLAVQTLHRLGGVLLAVAATTLLIHLATRVVAGVVGRDFLRHARRAAGC